MESPKIGHTAEASNHDLAPWITSSLGCANRSCGPPKPGRLLLSGVRRCRRRSAGGPLGPDGPRRARGDAVGSRMGPYINRAPIRDSRATRRAPAGDYMPRAALVVTHFFLGENRHAPQNDSFFCFIVTRQTAMPIQIVPRFCARGYGRFEKLLRRCQNR